MNEVYVVMRYCSDAGFATLDEDAGAWTDKLSAEEYVNKHYGDLEARYGSYIQEITLNKPQEVLT